MLMLNELAGFGACASGALAVIPTTWNPSDKDSTCTLSNGNLTTVTANSGYGCVRSIFSASAGKWYWEVTCTATGTATQIGIANASHNMTSYVGQNANGWAYGSFNGQKYNNGGVGYGATYTSGNVISVVLDLDAGTLTFWKNGATQGTAYTGLSGTFFAAISDANPSSGCTLTTNFGGSAFAYTPPAGYSPGFGP